MSNMIMGLQAGLWGALAGSALLVGAGLGYYCNFKPKSVASVMAFGSGVLISALAFDLMNEAYGQGGLWAATGGFLGGAVVFTGINLLLNRRQSKASPTKDTSSQTPDQTPSSQDKGEGGENSNANGMTIALGALLDGIPESIAIGITLLHGDGVSMATVAAVFLSNLPEGLSSAAGMKQSGRSPVYVLGVWGGIVLLSGIAAMAGYWIFAGASAQVLACITAIAAGAILAMLSDSMIPEAYQNTHNWTGLITVAGFMLAFTLSKLGG